MPRISTDTKSGLSENAGEKMHDAWSEPHERKAGPWAEHELDHAGHMLEHAERIKANPKFVEAIAHHHRKKAALHGKLAAKLKPHMKRGLVSERALEKASRSQDHA